MGRILLIFILCIFWSSSALSEVWYVDPVNGSMTNDGSQSYPWSTLEEVWESGKITTRYCSGSPCDSNNPTYVEKNTSGVVKAGDTIYLMSGYHGALDITGGYNTDWITIKAYPGEIPKLKYVHLVSVEKWWFDRLNISPSNVEPYEKSTLFLVEDHTWTGQSHNVTLKNSTLYGPNSIDGYTADDWSMYASMTGVHCEADNSTFAGNTLYHISNGFNVEKADNTLVQDNVVNHYMGDGVQVDTSSYVTIDHNTFKNVYTVDGGASHKDFIQFWTFSATVVDAHVTRNTCILSETPDKPYTEKVQGIGVFDGTYDGFVAENNLIITDTDHAISIYGSYNGRIVNNTAQPTGFGFYGGGAPIRFLPTKSGVPGENNVIANNFCTYISTNTGGISGGVVVNTNNIVSNVDDSSYFVDTSIFDYRLISASPAINAGSALYAPSLDILQHSRDAQPDIGAYEYGGVVTALKRHLRPSTGGMYIFSNGTHPVLNN